MKNKTFYQVKYMLVVVALFTYSCGKSGAYNSGNNTPPTPTLNEVSIAMMSFSPSTLTIVTGSTVTWTNKDAVTHTVTADGGSFDSGNLAPSSKFSKTFSTTGTYSYHCAIHSSMTGSIIVKAY